jgi:hypothetical protein
MRTLLLTLHHRDDGADTARTASVVRALGEALELTPIEAAAFADDVVAMARETSHSDGHGPIELAVTRDGDEWRLEAHVMGSRPSRRSRRLAGPVATAAIDIAHLRG